MCLAPFAVDKDAEKVIFPLGSHCLPPKCQLFLLFYLYAVHKNITVFTHSKKGEEKRRRGKKLPIALKVLLTTECGNILIKKRNPWNKVWI